MTLRVSSTWMVGWTNNAGGKLAATSDAGAVAVVVVVAVAAAGVSAADAKLRRALLFRVDLEIVVHDVEPVSDAGRCFDTRENPRNLRSIDWIVLEALEADAQPLSSHVRQLILRTFILFFSPAWIWVACKYFQPLFPNQLVCLSAETQWQCQFTILQ